MPGVIDNAAAEFGVDPDMMDRIARIESSHNPSARTGSYKGLFQLSDSEFNKWGGGNIYNARDNARAAARKIKSESADLEDKLGRPPTATEVYLVHQQGPAGFAAHSANPDAPAWQNMYSTGEGRQKGQGWAKQAIWGNVPDSDKARFGRVENVSSQDFMDVWHQKVEGTGAPLQIAEQHEKAGLPEQAGESVSKGTSQDESEGVSTSPSGRTRITVRPKADKSLASVQPDYISDRPQFGISDIEAIPIPQAPRFNIGRLKVPDYS